MPKSSDLNAAKKAKNDEFYTQRCDIEAELFYYADYFRGKIVYCNCDDPAESEFWKFFVRVFKSWGLKRLVVTCYNPSRLNFSCSVELDRDMNLIPVTMPIPGNGDFRSAACIDILKDADIVVTNPPFSLFREHVAQLIEYGKKFLVIGNMNLSTSKEIFPLIRDNKIWYGASIRSGDREFRVPDDYPLNAVNYRVDDKNRKYIRVKGVRWFTNLDIPQRHVLLNLRENYDPVKHLQYDNYDAINVDKMRDIPCDYDGVMGVPITFLDKYCPDQFEIVGASEQCGKGFSNGLLKVGGSIMQPLVNGERKYSRLFIRRK